jgi:phage major capsid protein, HK97 family|nr:MAG TPA: major capsid protein [Caudoviricetes sp.]
MNKQLILDAKLRMKAKALVTAEDAEKELSARSAELLSQVDSVETDEELNKLDESIELAQRELEAKQLEVRNIKEEMERIEAEIRSINDKQPKPEEGKREKMNNNEKREALAGYIREAEFKQGVTKVDGGALVPVEVLAPHDKKKNTVDLSALINVVKVNSASGKYPVISKSDAVMVSTEELAKNPELGKPTIRAIDYSIATYRGNVAISQEMIDDAAFDIIGKVAEDIKNQELNTKNAAIATVLKTATAKAAQGFDGLKDILNKELKPSYEAVFVVTQSMYAALDKVKDKDGKYMLQTDVTSPTGKSFAGKTIYTVEDKLLGNEGDMKAFIGDIKEFVTLFDRLQVTVQWTNNAAYGQLLGSAVRFDVKQVDGDAGFFVTYTDAA